MPSDSEVHTTLDHRLETLVGQAEELIRLLDADVSKAGKFLVGSERFRRAADAYQRLATAEDVVRSTRSRRWLNERVDGRDGTEVLLLLEDLIEELIEKREGGGLSR